MFSLDFMIQIGFPLFLLIVTFLIGSMIEKRHYADIQKKEDAFRSLPAITFETLPPNWTAARSGLVSGNVVISLDYFKRFLAGLRGLIGGRVKTYETLLDRGRREAIIRLKESAKQSGYNAVINVRLETSRLASGRRDGKGTAGVEVLAFGTGISLDAGLD